MLDELFKTRVAVLCTNANGEPEFHFCTVRCTQNEIKNGLHYDKAEESARDNGFSGQMVAFDTNDAAGKQLGKLMF